MHSARISGGADQGGDESHELRTAGTLISMLSGGPTENASAGDARSTSSPTGNQRAHARTVTTAGGGAAAASSSGSKQSRVLSPRLDGMLGLKAVDSIASSFGGASGGGGSGGATNDDNDDSRAKSFPDIASYVADVGGKRPISKILIANNGIAAVKCIRSIRRWSYETFGNEKMIQFVAMATPEDLKANAEYIHMADEFIRVPGGTNNDNYANIMLITEIAERCGAHAVWAGWGHASENPKLPELLAKTRSRVIWIGPPPEAMRALGDKIGSTLIAQSASVSCMPWSGDGLHVDYANTGIPRDIYLRACVQTTEDCVKAANNIGYPVMIKASEGGGGKGIRKVERSDQVDIAFKQVRGEVPGSPVFVMKLAPIARHLEVQLLADEWGDAIAAFGRDCSIQRRHQKIIEEGPVVAAPPHIWRQMEDAAIRLAKEVGYVGAGTVEYLYTPDSKYYFLELNPRLQVEHPVSELITGVNFPAAQLQIAMGVPLHRVRGIRRLYGKAASGNSRIDFSKEERHLLPGHVIACRITAENPDASFQPTSGAIRELNFRSTPDVWGYFSVSSSGSVHEFSDSQFGHLFSLGDTRDAARQNMIVALKELSIRGDIRTTIEYLPKVLETDDFRNNHVDTTWLERVMAMHSVRVEKPDRHLVVLLAAVYRANALSTSSMNEYVIALDKGQMPSRSLHANVVEMRSDLIYEGVKYVFEAFRSGPSSFDVAFGSGAGQVVVSVDAHPLADSGLLVLIGGKKHVVYGQEFPSGLRLTVDGKTCIFSVEYDPSRLLSAMAGKLVRFLAADGQHVEKDQAYAEMEVMKMYVAIKSPEAGILRIVRPEGSILESGDLIARLDLDKPDSVARAEAFTGRFPPMNDGGAGGDGEKANVVLGESKRKLEMVFSGYKLGPGIAERAVGRLMDSLRNPRLPMLEFERLFSALAGRIPEALYDEFQQIVTDYEKRLARHHFYWETPVSFPVADIQAAIDAQALSDLSSSSDSERATLAGHLSGILALLHTYSGGSHRHAAAVLRGLLEEYVRVEEVFNDRSRRPEHVIKELRRVHKGNTSRVATIALAHHQAQQRTELAQRLLVAIETDLTPLISEFRVVLGDICALNRSEHAALVLKARQLVMMRELPSLDERRIAIQTILSSAAAASSDDERLSRLGVLVQGGPIADMIFNFFTRTTNPLVMQTAMEALVRRTYVIFTIEHLNVKYRPEDQMILGHWTYRSTSQFADGSSPRKSMSSSSSASSSAQSTASASLHRVMSLSDISRMMVVGGNGSSGSNNLPVPQSGGSGHRGSSVPTTPRDSGIMRTGVMAFGQGFDHIKQLFSTILSYIPISSSGSSSSLARQTSNSSSASSAADDESSDDTINVLYLMFSWGGMCPVDDHFVQHFGAFLRLHRAELQEHSVRRVTFIVDHKSSVYPRYFTFRSRSLFDEDPIVRHIEPCYAPQLELFRLSNFRIQFVPTSNRMVHLFEGRPRGKSSAAAKSKGSEGGGGGEGGSGGGGGGKDANCRFFARVIVRTVDSHTLLGQSLELRRGNEAEGKHISSSSSSSSGDSAGGENNHNGSAKNTDDPAAAHAESGDGRKISLDAHPEIEFAFVEAMEAIETAVGADKTHWRGHSIFVNVLIDAVLPLPYVESVMRLLARRYADKINRLGISVVEACIRLRSSLASPEVVTYLFVCTNPTGSDLVIESYRHDRDQGGATVFRAVPSASRSASFASPGAGTYRLDGLPVSTPYPVEEALEAERMTARSLGTTYVYDYLVLAEKALRKLWSSAALPAAAVRDAAPKTGKAPAAAAGKGNNKRYRTLVPDTLVQAVELVMRPVSSASSPAPGKTDNRSCQDRLRDLTLVEEQRPAGHNDVGMVAWRVTLKTPSCPEGREVVIIANDITFRVGTFGVAEDLLFKLASEYARKRGIPRVYIAANSGARIGVAEEVRRRLQVAWLHDNPTKGFDYIYLDAEDAAQLGDSVVTQPVQVQGKGGGPAVTRHRITDIVGRQDGLGVENLNGSGMIAGETSLAYDEIFTLTYVTGRSVGIGAYLARLGHRCVQLRDSPIILTGFNALNKLLGRQVYTSNVQLGGVDIMYPNGVSHLVVDSELDGVHSIVKWLEYVPPARLGRASSLPVTPWPHIVTDPVDRPVEARPSSQPHDPRLYLSGHASEDRFVAGFFDRGSWMEVMGGWAQTVITGRARLGGIPVGVVSVETRTVESTVPADPASEDSKERVVLRAGQVWYPDSAYKTAQAVRDMAGEDLPVFVFANWRGFSGGQQDMYDEVLKFGSYIVDSLRAHTQPVFVYMPPHATLRGGAWVVVDPSINPDCMEMYAAEDSRGGVLEPEGTVDVKFRHRDIVEMAHRTDPRLQALDKQLEDASSSSPADESKSKASGALSPTNSSSSGAAAAASIRAAIAEREKDLHAVCHQVAAAFADLHDTPGRMKAKNAIRSVVEWAGSRRFFYWRLRACTALLGAAKRVAEAGGLPDEASYAGQTKIEAAKALVMEAVRAAGLEAKDGNDDDEAFVTWCDAHPKVFDEAVARQRRDAVALQVRGMAARGDAAGVEQVLKELLANSDPAVLRMISSTVQSAAAPGKKLK